MKRRVECLNNKFGKTIFAGWLLLVAAVSASRAEPINFMIRDLTFTRPSEWKWMEIEGDSPQARLKVPGASSNQVAHVEFRVFKTDDPQGSFKFQLDHALKMFAEPEGKIVLKKNVESYGERKVTWVEIEGTYQYFSRGLKRIRQVPDFITWLVYVPDPKGNVLVNAVGPKDLMNPAKADFRKMIENALKGE